MTPRKASLAARLGTRLATNLRAVLRAAAIVFVLALAGCSDEIKEVGSPCSEEKNDGCAFSPMSACILSWPEGYCTEYACNVGSCPARARCVRGVTFLDVPIDAFCLATCASDNDCREGYRCTDVSEPEKICAPIAP